MKLTFPLSIPFLLVVYCSFAQTNEFLKDKQCCCGITVKGYTLLRDRIPYDFPKVQPDLLPACEGTLNALIAKYEQQDKDNWTQLVNQACSYREGWVEKVPGTCQAGGPPPLCPQNHWVKEPQEAMNIWNRLQEKVFNLRLNEMKQVGCSCIAEKIDERLSEEAGKVKTPGTPPPAANPYSSGANAITVPCPNGECPPGYKCINGLCQPKNIGPKISETPVLGEIGKAAIDAVIIDLMHRLSPILAKLYEGINSTKLSVVTGVLESTTLSTWSNSYASSVRKLNDNLEKYKLLVQEYKRVAATYPNCSPCRDLSQIKIDMNNLKSTMNNQFNTINTYYAGILDEKESCKNCCQQVFVVYHKWFCHYYLLITN